MSKIKEILKEKTTWVIGVPSLIIGTMTLLDADHAPEVATVIGQAGETFVNTGDWKAAAGFLGMGLLSIFMKAR